MFIKFPSIKTSKLFVIAILFFAIVLALTSATARYVPYSKDSYQYAKYQEGLTLSPAPVDGAPDTTTKTEIAYEVPGFGLYLAPGVSPSIDKISMLKGSRSSECMQGNNLSTSTGALCLTDDMKKQLATRGGNA